MISPPVISPVRPGTSRPECPPRRRRKNAEVEWSPADLLVGSQGFYVDFAAGEGYTVDGDTWTLGGHEFTARGAPTVSANGVEFNARNEDMLVGGDELASIVRSYPLTIAANVARVDAGSMDVGVVANQAAYYALRPSASGNTSAVTRNTSYVSSGISSASPGGVVMGDYRADRTAIYADGRGPVYHNSQPNISGYRCEISIGGMSDQTPDYGTGAMKRLFIINRPLTDEERGKLLEYLAR